MTTLISKFVTSNPALNVLTKKVTRFSDFSKPVLLPVIGMLIFLFLWTIAASSINTSLGKFPGPAQVGTQMVNLYQEHMAEREKADAFYTRQDERNAKRIAQDPNYEAKIRSYTGKETFLDQIFTSLITVMSGFVLAAFIAVPLGIAIGLSKNLNMAINPIIQTFKPVSPLAWLPLVTIVVSAVYVTDDPFFEKAFLISLFTVTFCCLWPMIINTSVGVSSIDKDLVNVSRVLSLPTFKHIQKIVIPASIPMIFTGMRHFRH